MNVGYAIKVLIKNKGITQKDLSEATGISQTSISFIITGQSTPHRDTLESIANALGVKVEFIYFMSITRNDVPENRRELYDLIWPVVVKLFSE